MTHQFVFVRVSVVISNFLNRDNPLKYFHPLNNWRSGLITSSYLIYFEHWMCCLFANWQPIREKFTVHAGIFSSDLLSGESGTKNKLTYRVAYSQWKFEQAFFLNKKAIVSPRCINTFTVQRYISATSVFFLQAKEALERNVILDPDKY